MVADVDKKSCSEATCSNDNILHKNGTCVACEDYHKPLDKYKCYRDECEPLSILSKSGSCVKCPPY